MYEFEQHAAQAAELHTPSHLGCVQPAVIGTRRGRLPSPIVFLQEERKIIANEQK